MVFAVSRVRRVARKRLWSQAVQIVNLRCSDNKSCTVIYTQTSHFVVRFGPFNTGCVVRCIAEQVKKRQLRQKRKIPTYT